jgi:acyl-CoA synthetase (AMP-forming)/AMP-acid ligase II
LVRHAAILAQRRGLNRDDRIYSPMPFFWVGGLTMVLLAALTSGAGAVVQERFEPGQALELAEREHVTQISCWPNAAAAMAAHPDFATRDLSAVRGGTLIEALPVEQRPSTPDLMPMPLGMTETGGPHTSPDDYYAPLTESLRGTFGRALPGVEHSIAAADQDESTGRNRGELLLRGPLVMDSLYKVERHDAFTPDGWYPTGDLASFDSAGYLHFAGRATTVIKTAGSNVAPAEVESVLRELDGVTDAYVVGVQDEVRGQDVAAVIATEAGSTLDAEAVKRHAREQLSSFKVPRRVVFVSRDELPMLPTGKADLAALRSIFEAD